MAGRREPNRSPVSVSRFLRDVAVGPPVPGILLLGTDQYLREQCRAALVRAYVPEEARVWAILRLRLAETSLHRILEQAQSQPLLVPRQILFVEEIDALEKLKEEARDAAVEALEAYFRAPAPFSVLVFEAAALDQRIKLFKCLSSHALVVSVELAEGRTPEDRQQAAIEACRSLVPEMAREVGVEIEPQAADTLADVLSGDLLAIRTELDKLAAYTGERKRVSLADVDAVVVAARKYSVWQLADVLASRDRRRALEFLDSLLREGEQPAGVVAALAWMYRRLIAAQQAPAGLSGWEAARYLGMRKETAEMAIRQARKLSPERLLSGLVALYEADSSLKWGPPSHRAVLEFLVASLTA